MTTPREDAIPCRRHDWSAGHDYRGFQWVEATVCRRCGAVKAPREDAHRHALVLADLDTYQCVHCGKRFRLAALGAEAETPDPQRRWHRCEYPGCGLWHDSRDEVTL